MFNCTGKDANSCGDAVCVGYFIHCVCEDWWLDCFGVVIESGKIAHQVSDWEAAALQEGLHFVGVMSLVAESDVRTDWLSSIKATAMDDVVGLFAFWDCRSMRAVVIVLMAVQSSSSSSMRP